jgi:hypothetical protein
MVKNCTPLYANYNFKTPCHTNALGFINMCNHIYSFVISIEVRYTSELHPPCALNDGWFLYHPKPEYMSTTKMHAKELNYQYWPISKLFLWGQFYSIWIVLYLQFYWTTSTWTILYSCTTIIKKIINKLSITNSLFSHMCYFGVAIIVVIEYSFYPNFWIFFFKQRKYCVHFKLSILLALGYYKTNGLYT